MADIVGARFKKSGKIYYFKANSMPLKIGDRIIVETNRGIECAKVVLVKKGVDIQDAYHKANKIIRKATPSDLKRLKDNKSKSKKAFGICSKKIYEHMLNMKLIDVEYTFDNNKILFYFTADGRVDFRGLVKDLASQFRTRIELRQIGVRDESKMMGGLGVCGRPFCCSTFLGEFQPVSIKMAKEQGLSLNPSKISGTCGRLMCCLNYEQEAYSELLKITPKVGAIVSTGEGKGTVVESNPITGILKVSLDELPDAAPREFKVKQVKTLKDAKIELAKDELESLKNLEE